MEVNIASGITGVGNVLDYGADPTGVKDSTLSFNQCLLANASVWVPPGIYLCNSQIEVTQNYASFVGAGVGITTIKANNANLVAIHVTGKNYVTISGFTVDRSVAATSGGHGLVVASGLDNGKISDLLIQNQWFGFYGGGAASALIDNVTCQQNYSDGFHFDDAGSIATQWTLTNLLSQTNNGYGYWTGTAPGTTSVNDYNWTNCVSFANTLGGFWFVGTSTAGTSDIGMVNCLSSGDGNHGFLFSYCALSNRLTGCWVELTGTIATGRNLGTAKTNTGDGFVVDANSGEFVFSGCSATKVSSSGMDNGAQHTTISGCQFLDNGAAGIGTAVGISLSNISTKAAVSGTTLGNALTSFTKYGLFIQNGNNVTVTGCDLTGNSAGAVVLVSGTLLARGNRGLSDSGP